MSNNAFGGRSHAHVLLASLTVFGSVCPSESRVVYKNHEVCLRLVLHDLPAASVVVTLFTSDRRMNSNIDTDKGGSVDFGIPRKEIPLCGPKGNIGLARSARKRRKWTCIHIASAETGGQNRRREEGERTSLTGDHGCVELTLCDVIKSVHGTDFSATG